MKKMFVLIMMAMLIVIMTGCKNEVAENNDISWDGKENVITENIIEENILVEEIEVKEIEVKEIEIKTI